MKTSINPCHDFYEFACGNFKEVNKQLSGKMSVDQRIEELLQLNPHRKHAKPLKFVLNYHDSCVNQEKYVGNSNSLLKLVNSMISSSSTENWEVLAGKLALHGMFPIFEVKVSGSYKDRSKNMLMFAGPHLILDYPSYYSPRNLKIYKQYMKEYLKILNFTEVPIQQADFDEIIEFEKKLGATLTAKSANKIDDYSQTTYKSLKTKIKWDLFFEQGIKKYLGKTGLPETLPINIFKIQTFSNIDKLIENTSKNTIKKYLIWYLLQFYNEYLPEKYRKPRNKMREGIFNEASLDTKTRCNMEVREYLSIPLATAFSDYIDQDYRIDIEKIVGNIEKAMNYRIMQVDWLDERTRRSAMRKLEFLKSEIAYPKYVENETIVMEPFENIEWNPENYFENAVKLRKALTKHSFSEINQKPKAKPYIFKYASYSPEYNQISIPVTELQPPFYKNEGQDFINYGSLGNIIGHEITHAFDDYGSQFDEFGNIRNWWDEHTKKVFKNKTQCFVEQYNRSIEPLTGKNVDGMKTLSENIADNGGLRIAYDAFKNSQQNEKLKFKKFSQDQMFFIAYANTWCEEIKSKPEMEQYLQISPHAPQSIRVNLPLQNLPEFSEAFKCSENSKMNPKHRCKVW